MLRWPLIAFWQHRSSVGAGLGCYNLAYLLGACEKEVAQVGLLDRAPRRRVEPVPNDQKVGIELLREVCRAWLEGTTDSGQAAGPHRGSKERPSAAGSRR